MSQCTCKCQASEAVETPVREDVAVGAQPHNRRHGGKALYAFRGQERDEVIKLIQKAEKQERQMAAQIRSPLPVEEVAKIKLAFENERCHWSEMPNLFEQRKKVREPVRVPPLDFGKDDDFDVDLGDPEVQDEGEHSFAWQKLAGIVEGDNEDFKTTKCVKEKVVAVLCQKYNRMRFDWSNDPDSYLDQFLLINDARTKISATPLVEIFQAVSKISNEDEALATTCQVVLGKISSLFE